MQLVFVSIFKLNFSDGGPLYVGRAEHEGGLFPGKVKSVVFHLLGANSSVHVNPSVCVYSALLLNPKFCHILHKLIIQLN